MSVIIIYFNGCSHLIENMITHNLLAQYKNFVNNSIFNQGNRTLCESCKVLSIIITVKSMFKVSFGRSRSVHKTKGNFK
jgi:hypothetical protein